MGYPSTRRASLARTSSGGGDARRSSPRLGVPRSPLTEIPASRSARVSAEPSGKTPRHLRADALSARDGPDLESPTHPSGSGSRDGRDGDARVPDSPLDEPILATQPAPAAEDDQRPPDTNEEPETVMATQADPASTPARTVAVLTPRDDAFAAATRDLSERVYKDTGKRLSGEWRVEWTGSEGKRPRKRFVSPCGKRFDRTARVSQFIAEMDAQRETSPRETANRPDARSESRLDAATTPASDAGIVPMEFGDEDADDERRNERQKSDPGTRTASVPVSPLVDIFLTPHPKPSTGPRLSVPVDDVEGGVDDVEDGVDDVEGGVDDVEDGVDDVEDGVDDVEGGVDDVEDGVDDVEDVVMTDPATTGRGDGNVPDATTTAAAAATTTVSDEAVAEEGRVDETRPVDVGMDSGARKAFARSVSDRSLPSAPAVVDRRAGDAAARLLRKRLLAASGDNAPPASSLGFCAELKSHQSHLVDILGDTVTGGQNNSVLLVGARGSGKTLVLDSALRQLREAHGERIMTVRLSGMLHSDEKVGMREIAAQLCRAGDELEFSRAAGFMENVAFMREVLRVLESARRAVVFVLEEFDLFARGGANSKQTLLYSVMDLLQQNTVQAAVVGVTCRHDAVEMLEKRVRSRFSFRRILLAVRGMRAATLVRAALALPEPDEAEEGVKASETETEKVREESRATRPAGTAGAAQETRVSPGDAAAADALISARGVVYPPEPGYAARFNAALDAALAAPAGKKALASFEALECTPRAAADLALVALCRMDRDKGVVTAQDIAKATQALLADTYVRSLSGASVLELCLVVAMSRLHRFRNMPSFNFQHVEAELRTMAANDFLGDAGRAKGPVLTRAFEGLLAMGLVEACAGGGGRGLAGGAIQSSAGGSRAPRAAFAGAGHFKQFRGIQLLITDEEVEVAVEKHPQKPAGLPELLVHEGVRTATGF